MATSGSKTISVASNNTIRLKFQWEVVSQSVIDNTSTINWKLVWINNNYNLYENSYTASMYWRVIIDGEEFDGTRTISLNVYQVSLNSGTAIIKHNDDGTKSFEYFFGITYGSFNATTEDTAVLDQILRASSLTAANGTLGTAQTLTITPQDATYKHKIQYTCGSASGYAAGSASAYASGTSISWTPPLTLAQQNTTGTSVSVTLKLITYTSDGTQLGSASKTITCAIPASVKPSISIAVSDLTDNFSTFGKYVQSKSKLKIALTASGSQGSTITAYKTTADGNNYTAATIETDVVKGSGTLTISATVTDSRGRTATASTTISVYAYEPPALEHITIQRCNSDGTANSSGSYLSVTFDAAITSMDSKNSATYTLQYKKTSATSYTVQSVNAYSNKYSVTGGVIVFAADAASSYDVILKAADHYSSVQRSGVGSSISKLFSILKHGKGIALNKVAEEEGVFDVNFTSYFRGGLKHPSLADNANLNDVVIPNTYNGRSDGGYSNCPTTLDFTLEVLTASAGAVIIQRLTDNASSAPTVYSRSRTGGTWGSWQTKTVNFTLAAGASASIAFSGQTQAMIYCRGWQGALAAVFNYSGYGAGAARQGLITFVNHGGVSCGLNLESAGQGMTITNNGSSALYICIDLKIGGNAIPAITYTAANAAAMSSSCSYALADSISNVASALASDVLKVVVTSVTTSQIAANGYLSQQSVAATQVEGYTLIYPLNVQSNSSYSLVYALWLSGGSFGYSVRNLSSSAVTPTLSIRGLYMKTT